MSIALTKDDTIDTLLKKKIIKPASLKEYMNFLEGYLYEGGAVSHVSLTFNLNQYSKTVFTLSTKEDVCFCDFDIKNKNVVSSLILLPNATETKTCKATNKVTFGYTKLNKIETSDDEAFIPIYKDVLKALAKKDFFKDIIFTLEEAGRASKMISFSKLSNKKHMDKVIEALEHAAYWEEKFTEMVAEKRKRQKLKPLFDQYAKISQKLEGLEQSLRNIDKEREIIEKKKLLCTKDKEITIDLQKRVETVQSYKDKKGTIHYYESF